MFAPHAASSALPFWRAAVQSEMDLLCEEPKGRSHFCPPHPLSTSARTARGHSVRVLARLRPYLEQEESEDVPCLRRVSSTQLEVLLEPRVSLLASATNRSRRRTIGGLPHVGCKSAGMLHLSSRGLFEPGLPPGRGGFESRTFSFDQVYDSGATDDQVFAGLEEELRAALDGEAVCILAYGATGSGKTHTVSNLAERVALTLSCEAEILEKDGVQLEVLVQVVEIYNEHFRDLLTAEVSPETPRLKMSSPSSSATLQGATQRRITREKDMLKSLQSALRFGQAQRATCSTSVHGRSSRSHLVMMMYFFTCDDLGRSREQRGRLSLVDLAGSERIKCSEATGDRLREAQHINRSLSALADVVVAKEKGVPHVPYRNSKLTHLLQDALGGQQKSRTVIIIALPPTRSALGETLHSLQLSSRLNSIAAQRIFLPEQPSEDDACLAFARQEAERLRLENARMRSQLEQLEEHDQARELELRELREQIQACVHSQVRPGIQQVQCGSAEKWRSTSPPSPVLEADSSAEMSREIAEQAEKATPDGLHVMPGPDVMDSAGAERRTLDFTETCEGGMFNSSLCPHGRGRRSAGPTASTDEPVHSGEADWRWTDPKENSLQLHLVPSPARSRRASEAGETHRSRLEDSQVTDPIEEDPGPGALAEAEVQGDADISGGHPREQPQELVPPCVDAVDAAVPTRRPEAVAQAARARSASCRSRSYVVEAITPSEAEELTRSAVAWSSSSTGANHLVPETWLKDEEFLSAKTDFLMLSEVPASSGEELEPESPGRISVSSDEAEIKDRLKALLKHRPVVSGSAGPNQARHPGATRCEAPRPADSEGPLPCRAASGTGSRPSAGTAGVRRPHVPALALSAVAERGVNAVHGAAEKLSARRTREDAGVHRGSLGHPVTGPRATRERAAARIGHPLHPLHPLTPREGPRDSRGRAKLQSPSTGPVRTMVTTATVAPSTPRQMRNGQVARAVSASPTVGPSLTWSGLRPVPARHSLQSRAPCSPLGSCSLAWQSDLRSPPLARLATPRQRAPYAVTGRM